MELATAMLDNTEPVLLTAIDASEADELALLSAMTTLACTDTADEVADSATVEADNPLESEVLIGPDDDTVEAVTELACVTVRDALLAPDDAVEPATPADNA